MTRTRKIIALTALAAASFLAACQPATLESCDPLPGASCTPEHP